MILGDGKTPEQVAAIAREMASRGDRFLITRAGPSLFEAVKAEVDEALYHSTARVISLNRRKRARLKDGIVLITGGTADQPVAEEAAVTCELMGQRPERVYDVGVAGLHRLLDHLGSLQKANVIIAIAGMEGALPGVVGGL
ncbi:MAG: 1-(5-phosphoribosyl)-5-amino-4-imidazole-carboxylate carboxylase, partial [Chloroflexi bacterium]|nr:1-(5-phosphoribosyl)-5-amino-4-imidazole-carboxylate carboxylase [Chloroflexota bacterium]